jgi:hypothetical protein
MGALADCLHPGRGDGIREVGDDFEITIGGIWDAREGMEHGVSNR